MSSNASLLETVERLAEAERRGDLKELQQLLALDYQGYDPAGRSQNRASVLRAYGATGALRVTDLRHSELSARVVGEVGLVAGISQLRGRHGKEHFELRLRFLDVYAWREARWQLVASQDTRLPW